MITTNKKLASLIIYIFSAIIVNIICFIASPASLETWAVWFVMLSSLLFIMTIVSFLMAKVRVLSIFGLIAVMSYLFQFSSAFCLAVNFNADKLNSRMSYYGISHQVFKDSARIALICVTMFTIGGLIENLFQKEKKNNFTVEKGIGINPSFYKMMGYIIVIISGPLWLYTMVYSARIIASGQSYTALAEAMLPGYITSFGKFVYVGIMMIIFYHHLNKNSQKKYFWIALFLALLGSVMILGARSEPVTIFFAFLIFCDRCLDLRKILDFKYVIPGVVIVFVLANFLYSIQISRNSGFNVLDVVTRFFSNGPDVIMQEIFEFGYTEYSTASVVNNIKMFHPTWFFIKEISSITPIPIQSEYTVVASVAAGTPELGTSYIGEMYYYFGSYCPFACLAIAMYIVKIEKWISNQVENQNYYMFFMFLMWTWQELNCIRASFNLSIKTMIYSFLLFEFVRMIYYGAFKGKKYKRVC